MSYIDSSLMPSLAQKIWLYHGKDDGDISGKWMLFYDRARIDTEWKRIKELYDESKLGNVISMKCSGALDNPYVIEKNEHVIVIYCNYNKDDIFTVGKNIVNSLIDYSSPYIYYKLNSQTTEGTRWTGSIINHVYKLSANSTIKCLILDD